MRLTAKIKNLLQICLIFLGTLTLQAQEKSENQFKTGADRPDLYLSLLKNKSIAVVANATSRLADGTYLVDF